MTPDFSHEPVDRWAAGVAIGSLRGYVFAGDGVDMVCFVPEDLVAFGPAGEAIVDFPGYFQAGWSQRNARSSDSEAGVSHVFPDSARLIDHRSMPNLRAQLERWRKLAESDAKARD